MDWPVVVGIIAGCVGAILIIGVIVGLCLRRKRRAARREEPKVVKVQPKSVSASANGSSKHKSSNSNRSHPEGGRSQGGDTQIAVEIPAVYESPNFSRLQIAPPQNAAPSAASPHVMWFVRGGNAKAENAPVTRESPHKRPPSQSEASKRSSKSSEHDSTQKHHSKQNGSVLNKPNSPELQSAGVPVPRPTVHSPPPQPPRLPRPLLSPNKRHEIEGGNPYAVSGIERIEFDGGYVNHAASIQSSLEEVHERRVPTLSEEKRPEASAPYGSPLGSQLVADSNAFTIGNGTGSKVPLSPIKVDVEPDDYVEEHIYANRAFVNDVDSEPVSPASPISPASPLSPVQSVEPVQAVHQLAEPVYINYVSPPGSVPDVMSSAQTGKQSDKRQFSADTLTALQLAKHEAVEYERAHSNSAPRTARSSSAHALHSDTDMRFSLPATASSEVIHSALVKSNRSIASASSAGSFRKKVTWANNVKAPDDTVDEARQRYERNMPKTVSMAESCV